MSSSAAPISRPVRAHLGPSALPRTIATLLHQLRFWRLLQAATTLVGAPRNEITYRHPAHGHQEETRGSRSAFNSGTGSVDYTVGIEFPVNGKIGEDWRMAIAYEGDDTYHAWLWGEAGVIEHSSDLYAENLVEAVVELYDGAIRERNQGFIPLG